MQVRWVMPGSSCTATVLTRAPLLPSLFHRHNTGAAGRAGLVPEDPGARGGYLSLQLQAAAGPKGCTHPERTGTLRNVGCHG